MACCLPNAAVFSPASVLGARSVSSEVIPVWIAVSTALSASLGFAIRRIETVICKLLNAVTYWSAAFQDALDATSRAVLSCASFVALNTPCAPFVRKMSSDSLSKAESMLIALLTSAVAKSFIVEIGNQALSSVLYWFLISSVEASSVAAAPPAAGAEASVPDRFGPAEIGRAHV